MHFKLKDISLPVQLRRHGAFLGLLILLLVQWALLFSDAGPSWDAAVYYAYTRSAVFDGDLRIANDLLLSYPTAAPEFAAARIDLNQTETGRVASPFALGSSLLWLPWLATLRALAGLGQLVGLVPQLLTGFEWYFALGVATMSMILGWLSFWLAYRLALEVSEKPSALLATATLLFTTPLLFYMYNEVMFAHAPSAFVIALFITVWWRYFRRPSSYATALATGALLGLTTLVRWQHIVYAVLPLFSIGGWWFSLPANERRAGIMRALLTAALVGLGAAAVLSLQLAHWHSLYDRWITVPQGSDFMDWSAPYWREVLFSTFKGVLSWMPVFFLALAGLLLQLKRHRQFILPLLIALLLEMYISGSSLDWFGGGGYGPRRLTGEIPILVIGYAAFLQWLPQRFRLATGGLLAGALILHQWLLLRFGLVDQVGGRILSMAPTFNWAADGYAVYFQQLGSYLADFIRQPLAFFYWSSAPLGTLYDGRLPLRHGAALLSTVLFVAILWLAGWRLARRYDAISPAARWALLLALGLVILLADYWLLAWA